MDELDKKIELAVRHQPGKKAFEISRELKLSRKVVNSFLYGSLKGKCIRDNEYKWYPKGFSVPEASETVLIDTVITSSKIRGKSLFLINPCAKPLVLTYNSEHPFFSSVYSKLDANGRNAVDLLFESLSILIEQEYSQDDIFEDIVHQWGQIVYKKILNTASVTN